MTPRTGWTFLVIAAGVVAVVALGLWGFRARVPAGAPVTPRDAKATYERDCAVCHGSGGKGDGPGARVVGQRIRDFTDPVAMSHVSDAFLFAIIQKGGSQFGRSNAMPAWGMKLSDAEIHALVHYIRSLAR